METVVPKEKLALSKILTRNIILIMAIHFCAQCGGGMINSVQGQLGKALDLGTGLIGAIASVYTFVAMFMRIPGGSLVRKMNTKKLLVILCGIRILVGLLFCITDNAVLYTISRLLNGAMWSAAGVIVAALMSVLVDKKVLGTFYSLYLAISYGGKLLCRPWAVKLFNTYGDCRVIGLIAAGFFLIATLLALLFDTSDPNIVKVRERAANAKQKSFNIFEGICLPALPMMAIVCAGITCFNIENLYTPIMTQAVGVDCTPAMSVAAIVTVVAMFAFGALCDVISPKFLTVLTMLFQGIGTIFMARSGGNAQMFFIFYMIYAIGNRWDIPFNVYLLKNVTKRTMPTVTATMLCVQDIWSFLSTIIFGAVAASYGYPAAYFWPGLLCIIGGLFVWFFSKKNIEKIVAFDEKETAKVTAA